MSQSYFSPTIHRPEQRKIKDNFFHRSLNKKISGCPEHKYKSYRKIKNLENLELFLMIGTHDLVITSPEVETWNPFFGPLPCFSLPGSSIRCTLTKSFPCGEVASRTFTKYRVAAHCIARCTFNKKQLKNSWSVTEPAPSQSVVSCPLNQFLFGK